MIEYIGEVGVGVARGGSTYTTSPPRVRIVYANLITLANAGMLLTVL